jgi:hypothetical protein
MDMAGADRCVDIVCCFYVSMIDPAAAITLGQIWGTQTVIEFETSIHW